MADIESQTLHSEAETLRDEAATSRRKRAFIVFGAVLALLAALFLGYRWLTGGRYVETDNAYVGAETAQVTPQVGGTVKAVAVSDTQSVRKGDILVVIDDSDARIALAQAEADYAQALRRVRQTFATARALGNQVSERSADIQKMQAQVSIAAADLERARIDLTRRESLAKDGAVSGEELSSARNAFASANGALAAARAGLAQAQAARGSAQGQEGANAALIEGTTEATNPEVLAAKARLDKARLDLARTVVRAPVDGVVTSRAVQVGQRVAAGATLMTIVPVGQAYVDANFKEGQLRTVRPGQTAELVSDLYGDDVVFTGRVVGLSGGTGSSLAVIPAQNATGNWIKVVQRVPVRIALDPQQLKAHPLRVGLSMTATIDTKGR
ncbi:HlyD family secretion protein [Novosphingobium huizhouense]|uniref:HlyD family secretion protein n=1 Tax=Novosphingobium huizhouense TaxID=2866625 RepID=UPI001CD8236B|nr:HlyD family efflux transporter periplasmic adaptor subunit [Novosphingobium huizhouense]